MENTNNSVTSNTDYDLQEFKKHGKTTPLFSLNGLCTYARVVNVYDGDTITCVIKVFDNWFKFNVRLNGIDTCELHSTDTKLKALAIKAKKRLISLITEITESESSNFDKGYFENHVVLVWLECQDFDKYGRLLANIYKNQKDKISFSDILIQEKFGYKYDGGTKIMPNELD